MITGSPTTPICSACISCATYSARGISCTMPTPVLRRVDLLGGLRIGIVCFACGIITMIQETPALHPLAGNASTVRHAVECARVPATLFSYQLPGTFVLFQHFCDQAKAQLLNDRYYSGRKTGFSQRVDRTHSIQRHRIVPRKYFASAFWPWKCNFEFDRNFLPQ